MPYQDKLIQLSLYKQLIEAKFNIEIPWLDTCSHNHNNKKMHVLWRKRFVIRGNVLQKDLFR
jgi:hypothetical protein